MLYYFIRPFARFALLAFCKKIYVSGAEHIKSDRPVLLASNHPTAFLEPCILACFLPVPIHFVVRADFFKTPFYTKLMYSLHLIPIHRQQNSAYKDLKQNFDLIEGMQQKLHQNKTLMVLVEGSASIKKRLRPLQKGIARLAFGTYERYQREDIEIVPVSVNFDYPSRARLSPMIVVGEPIAIKDFLPTYKVHSSKAINELIQVLQSKMQQNLLHIENEADDELVEQLLEIYRNQYPIRLFPIFERKNDRLLQEIRLVRGINQMPIALKQDLKTVTTTYFDALNAKGWTDFSLVARHRRWAWIGLILGSIVYGIGYLPNFFLPAIAKKIATKKVKKIQYFAPIYWAISALSYLFYFLLLSMLAIVSKELIWVVVVFFMPLLGYFCIVYREAFDGWVATRKVFKASEEAKQQLLYQRNKIFVAVSSVLQD